MADVNLRDLLLDLRGGESITLQRAHGTEVVEIVVNHQVYRAGRYDTLRQARHRITRVDIERARIDVAGMRVEEQLAKVRANDEG